MIMHQKKPVPEPWLKKMSDAEGTNKCNEKKKSDALLKLLEPKLKQQKPRERELPLKKIASLQKKPMDLHAKMRKNQMNHLTT
jgi:hypothetical protein